MDVVSFVNVVNADSNRGTSSNFNLAVTLKAYAKTKLPAAKQTENHDQIIRLLGVGLYEGSCLAPGD